MGLSQIQLEAFFEVSKSGSFTQAAASLHVTQSALSHRIRNLEEALETTLLIRQGSGTKLTDAGAKLLQYYRIKSQLEDEIVGEITALKKSEVSLKGFVRVGSVSTLSRSVVLPSIAKLTAKNLDVRLEMMTKELSELPRMLANGQVDFLVSPGKLNVFGLVETILGHESYVLIQPDRNALTTNIYLDHDMEDQTTHEFFKFQKVKKQNIMRSFLDEIYTVIDGVAEGLGNAVVPLHLVKNRKDLKIVQKYKPMEVPVYLYYLDQPYYTKLSKASIKCFEDNIPILLKT